MHLDLENLCKSETDQNAVMLCGIARFEGAVSYLVEMVDSLMTAVVIDMCELEWEYNN